MRGRTCLLLALALPVALPVLCWPLAYAEADAPRRVAQLLVGSLVIGGGPYALFAVLALAWARGRGEDELRRGALLAPVLFLVPLLSLWTFLHGPDGGVPAATLAFFAVFALAFGYAYVLLALGVYRLLRRRRRVQPPRAPAMA